MDEKWDKVRLAALEHCNSADYFSATGLIVRYLTQASEKAMMAAVEDSFNFLEWISRQEKNRPGYDEARDIVTYLYGWILAYLPRKHRLLFVRLGLRHLTEDLDLSHAALDDRGDPISKWALLWAVFIDNHSLIANAVQERQLRSLAKKLIKTYPLHPCNNSAWTQFFLFPQPELARLNRFKWFRDKNPKWLALCRKRVY